MTESPPVASSLTPHLSFIIPVLNEAESLTHLHTKIVTAVESNALGSYEILFVDDGSTDASWQTIQSLANEHPSVHGLRFRRNFGKAAALATGFANARGQIVFTLDADLQDDPAEVPRFLEKLNEGYDLVSGWKKNRHDPLEKRLPSKLFNQVACRLGGIQLHDMNCGFKAYRREVLSNIHLYGELHRYIPVLAHAEGFRVGEIPVLHHPRQHGVSKYGWTRYFKGMLDLLTVMAITRYLHRPGHLFGGIGILSFLVGFLILFYISCMKFLADMPISGRPLFFLGILLLLLGSQLVSLGVLGELIIRFQPHDSATKVIEQTAKCHDALSGSST